MPCLRGVRGFDPLEAPFEAIVYAAATVTESTEKMTARKR